MEDYKLRDLRASHTLGWSWVKRVTRYSSGWFVFYFYFRWADPKTRKVCVGRDVPAHNSEHDKFTYESWRHWQWYLKYAHIVTLVHIRISDIIARNTWRTSHTDVPDSWLQLQQCRLLWQQQSGRLPNDPSYEGSLQVHPDGELRQDSLARDHIRWPYPGPQEGSSGKEG